jgi:hypothetical protein
MRQSQATRFHHEGFHRVGQPLLAFLCTAATRRQDDGADPWPHFNEPIPDQLLDRLMRGVGIDLELRTQLAYRGEEVAWREDAATARSSSSLLAR